MSEKRISLQQLRQAYAQSGSQVQQRQSKENPASIFMKKLDRDGNGKVTKSEIHSFLSSQDAEIANLAQNMGLQNKDKAVFVSLLQRLEASGRDISNARLVTLEDGKQAFEISFAPNKKAQIIETYDKDTGALASYTYKKKNDIFTIIYDNNNTKGMVSSSKKYTVKTDGQGRVLVSSSGKKKRQNTTEYTYSENGTRPERVVERHRNGTVIVRENGEQTITRRSGRVIKKKDEVTIDSRALERIIRNRKPSSGTSSSITQAMNGSAKDIASQLQKVLYGAGSNSADFQKLISQISSSNFDWVKYEYKKLTKKELLSDLEVYLKKRPNDYANIKRHLAEVQYAQYGVNLNFKNQNSVVSNRFRKGDSHSVVQNGTILTIRNNKSGKQRTIDLDKLLQNYPNARERAKLIKMLQKMPGEVLMDIAIETDSFIPSSGETVNVGRGGRCQAAGYYNPSDDTVHIDPEKGVSTIVHETGHMVDFNRANSKRNNSSVLKDPEFKRIFNDEMRKYISAGNKRYVYDPSGRSNSPRGTYATANEREMFAECYTLLMLGNCGSEGVITKYFPRTLAYINQKIEYNRQYSDSVRH